MAGELRWLEQRNHNPRVVGSNPTLATNKTPGFSGVFPFYPFPETFRTAAERPFSDRSRASFVITTFSPPKKNTLLPCSNLFRHLVSFSVLSGIIPHIKTFSRLISRRFSSSPKAPDANCLYSCLVVQKPKEKTEKTYIFFFGVTIFTTRIKTTKKNKNGPNKNPGETGVSICSKRYRKLFRSRQALNRSKRGKSQQYGGSADQNIYDTAQNAH